MKHKNLLILSVTALATTAIGTFAQEAGVRRTSEHESAIIIAAQDAQEQSQRASAQAANTQRARLQHVIGRSGNASRMLVIPKDATDVKGFAEVEEDLNVMAHILDKAVSGGADKTARAMGIAVTPRPLGFAAGPQNLFIEGYGALFFLNVNYPLIPPPAKEVESEPKGDASNEWEEARREISQPQHSTGRGFGGGGGFGSQNPFSEGVPIVSGGNTPEYDADKVEELKKDLIAGLKNAAHIRKLKSDETVIVVVYAPGPGTGAKTKVSPTIGDGTPDEPQVAGEYYQSALETFRYVVGPPARGPSTKLILRVRKADAEAFQKRNLTFEEFRKKVSLILY